MKSTTTTKTIKQAKENTTESTLINTHEKQTKTDKKKNTQKTHTETPFPITQSNRSTSKQQKVDLIRTSW